MTCCGEDCVRLSRVIAPTAVKLNMEASDKEEAFEELVDLLVQNGAITDREAALKALDERESLGSTGIGNSIAVPHGKHAGIPQLTGALGISHGGIRFGSADGKPVHIVFLLLARTDNPGPHIQALAQIAQLAQSQMFPKKALEARTPQEVLELLRREE
jgi:mannitol/fructose-specific phosphotransferase system IIA component (Ntr-type)